MAVNGLKSRRPLTHPRTCPPRWQCILLYKIIQIFPWSIWEMKPQRGPRFQWGAHVRTFCCSAQMRFVSDIHQYWQQILKVRSASGSKLRRASELDVRKWGERRARESGTQRFWVRKWGVCLFGLRPKMWDLLQPTIATTSLGWKKAMLKEAYWSIVRCSLVKASFKKINAN